MPDTVMFTLKTLAIGLAFSFVAAIIERLLINFGVVRGDTKWLIGGTILLVFFIQLYNPNISFLCLGPFIMFMGPIIVNRHDFVKTISAGRWWWKAKDGGQQREL